LGAEDWAAFGVQVYPRLLEVDIEGRELNARLIDADLRYTRREERDLEARATQVEEHLGRRPKIRIVTVGDPAAVLLEAAEEEDAPEKILLAVGSRTWGRGSAWDSGASRPRCSEPLGDRSWCIRAVGTESAISFRNLFLEEVHA
jgi:hypothetical protein